MTKLKFVILFVVLMIGVAAVHAQDESKVAITLERTACFGTCPMYTISILENGDVIYNGEKFVDVTGEQKSQLDPETVAAMVKAFEDVGYFDWKEAYDTMTVTDMPYIITSVTRNGETHRITRYVGDSSAPLALSFLERWIDEMTGSQMWTGAESDLLNAPFGSPAPVITLGRSACFGKCPVYNVVVLEDGTVVYTGSANVDKIGVTIVKTDAPAIEGVVQRAKALGYFDWKDSYTQQVMTDQVTVTTSIRSEDQVKQITRYNGDPNAPIGLLWIEESIDQLLTNSFG
jgi:hypothetical protein